jgi:phosphonate transport system substrate-binding protein
MAKTLADIRRLLDKHQGAILAVWQTWPASDWLTVFAMRRGGLEYLGQAVVPIQDRPLITQELPRLRVRFGSRAFAGEHIWVIDDDGVLIWRHGSLTAAGNDGRLTLADESEVASHAVSSVASFVDEWWIERGVRLNLANGSQVVVAAERRLIALADPAYDVDRLIAEAGWAIDLAKGLAAWLGVPHAGEIANARSRRPVDFNEPPLAFLHTGWSGPPRPATWARPPGIVPTVVRAGACKATARMTIGAVAYDAKVVTIWEGIRDHLAAAGLHVDFALYSSYERQVEALLDGDVDIAWNAPLAHVRVRRRTNGTSRSLAMRDTDRDVRTKIIARRGEGISSIEDLVGRTLAVGSRDSTQARILPMHFLTRAGVHRSNIKLLPFDTDVGKHGDTGTSEMDVVQAVLEGRADAGAIGDVVWNALKASGRVNDERVEVVWTSPPFDHCMFDALATLPDEAATSFESALFAMSWADPCHRKVLELEGLKQWLPSREDGYGSLFSAVDEQDLW